MATKSNSKKSGRAGMSERSKKIVLATTGGVMLLGAGYWAYMAFTTVPPPSLATAKPEEVVRFLGNPRGFPAMSMEAREKYVVEAYQKFAQGDQREQMVRAFAQMSAREKQVFVDTSFDAFKTRFLANAAEYNRLPKTKRDQFVDKMVQTFEVQRQSVSGGGGADNVGEAFKSMVPNTTDGMTKALVSRTNSRQRAKAQPLFDHVAARYQQLKESGKAR